MQLLYVAIGLAFTAGIELYCRFRIKSEKKGFIIGFCCTGSLATITFLSFIFFNVMSVNWIQIVVAIVLSVIVGGRCMAAVGENLIENP